MLDIWHHSQPSCGRSGTDLLDPLLYWGLHQTHSWWLVHFQGFVVLATWLHNVEMSSPAMPTFLFGYRDWSGTEWFHPRRLDLVLILVGLLALLVIPVLAAETSVSFEKLLVVRGLRLLRLVRALRLGALWGLERKRWWCKMSWFEKCIHRHHLLLFS